MSDFVVLFCLEHEKELEALQAAFEQAICHLSKRMYWSSNNYNLAVNCQSNRWKLVSSAFWDVTCLVNSAFELSNNNCSH